MAEEASTSSSKAGAGVVFKKKRGPAGRSALGSRSSTSAGAEPSSSSSTQTGSRPSGRNNESESDGSDDEDPSTVVVLKKKRRTGQNPLLQSTGSSYKKLKRGDEGDDSDDDYDGTGSLKPTDRFGDSGASSIHKSSGGTSSSTSKDRIRQDATKHSDWDLEAGNACSTRPSTHTGVSEPASNFDGNYHGAASYGSFIKARDDGSSAKFKARGPIKSSTTVRSVTLMDYQPDICKDYKETGYCGFGDTCKFLHDRSDYLAGWQLDVLPNSNKRNLREDFLSDPEDASQEDDDEEEEIPFACLICRQPFTDPVVTKCGHYFCSSCAIKRYAKNPKCFACGAQTSGLFNSATKIIQKMQSAKQKKDDARAEKRAQHGLGDQDCGVHGERQLLDGVQVGNDEVDSD